MGNDVIERDETALSLTEKSDLTVLETRIEKNLGSFVQVGLDLQEIKNRQLYREDFRTWEDYLINRWGFGREYGRLLMNSALIVSELPTSVGEVDLPTPQNESQVRALAKAPPEKRGDVWTQAVKQADGGQPRAVDVENLARRAGVDLDHPDPIREEIARVRQETEEVKLRREIADKSSDLEKLTGLLKKAHPIAVRLEFEDAADHIRDALSNLGEVPE